LAFIISRTCYNIDEGTLVSFVRPQFGQRFHGKGPTPRTFQWHTARIGAIPVGNLPQLTNAIKEYQKRSYFI
jgi:hypothetical protein